MIKTLQLKNFRQHTDLALSFDQGVTVLRGANEAGKSTVFEAIAYALFGARATRNNELTTWGQPEGSHQVLLTFEIGGVEYTIKRNAKSAELNYEGGRVTGQTDTARFCEQLLDLKSGMGTKLMLVPQNEMRGTLSDGGAKTTAMIEQLADLGQIEEIITKLQTHWHTGKTDLIEHSLETFKQQHAEAKEELAATEDPERGLQDKLTGLKEEQQMTATGIQHLSEGCQALSEQLAETQAVEAERRKHEQELLVVQTELQVVRRDLAQPLPEFDETAVEEAEQYLAALEQQRELAADFLDFAAYVPTHRVQMTERDLHCALQIAQDVLQAASNTLQEHKAHRAALKSQISHDLVCPTCKREWENAEQMRQANAEKEALIAALDRTIAEEEGKVERSQQEVQEVSAVLSQPIRVPPRGSRWQVIEDGLYPPMYHWPDEVPQSVLPEQLQDAKNALHQARVAKDVYHQKLARQEQARATAGKLEARRTELQQNLSAFNLPEKSSEELKLRLHDQQRALHEAEREMQRLTRAIENFGEDHRAVREAYRMLLNRVDQASREVERYTEELKAARQANALLKALRTIKPQLANQVWQTVCSTVSHYFSLMRNQPSVVSKEAAGFAVDGHDTESLSGSTLDILGLAIRIALTKTFMPTCRFLLLDEPFAASDAERTAQALGFISSVGFDQVVIITHEDATEAVADNLITI